MPRIDIIVALLALSIPLVAIARAIRVGYPILLVLGGLVLCFVPGLPRSEIEPNLVFLVFLPPLLYWQTVTAPIGRMRSNLGSIGSLAIGLVLATAVVVAVVAKAIVPGLGWPAAVALGAIVAPTDDVAFWPVAERLGLSRHITALIGGEALLNDAPSLVLYAVAIAAVISGSFSPGGETLRLLWTVPCSIAIGAIVGIVVSASWRRIRDPHLQTMMSVIAPYLAYLPAMQSGLSGVLAVVTAAVWLNRASSKFATPEARQRTAGFWETALFVMNAIMFVLIGLHLHETLPTLQHYPPAVLIGSVVAVNLAVVGVRIAWVFVGGLLADRFAPVGRARDAGRWKARSIVAWAGLRGGVSLAAALALPRTLANGTPFAHRDLIILVAFSVILVTLVGQGLTLPAVAARAGVKNDADEEHEERRVVATMQRAALRRVDELERDGTLVADHAHALRKWYVSRRKAESDGTPPSHHVVRELVNVERSSLLEALDRGMIDNTVMRRMQAALDLEELQLDHLHPQDARK